jgi:hypothetical protein
MNITSDESMAKKHDLDVHNILGKVEVLLPNLSRLAKQGSALSSSQSPPTSETPLKDFLREEQPNKKKARSKTGLINSSSNINSSISIKKERAKPKPT